MGVLQFDGTDDQLKWTTLASALANTSDGAVTMAVLLKLSDLTHFSGLAYLLSGAGAGTTEFGLSFSPSVTGPLIDAGGGFSFPGGADPSINTTYLWIVSKAAGTVNPRIGVQAAGGAMSHFDNDVGGTMSDQAASAQIQIGTWQDTDFMEGWIGVVAFWEGAMSEADKEAIGAAWATSAMWESPHGQPTFLAELNVAGASVVDLAGNASSLAVSGSPALDAAETLGDWTFDGTGLVFPTTPVLADFNQSDVDPVPPPWLGPLISGEGQLEIVSNRARGNTAGVFNGSYRGPYGADQEVYFVVPTISVGNRIEGYLRVNIDGLGTDGYCVSVVGTTWTLRVVNNSTSSALGAHFTGPAIAAGDAIGARVIGTDLEAWHKPAAGSWTQLFTRSDSTYAGPGMIGARMFGDAFEIEDFGGGTYGGEPDVTYGGHIRRGLYGVA